MTLRPVPENQILGLFGKISWNWFHGKNLWYHDTSSLIIEAHQGKKYVVYFHEKKNPKTTTNEQTPFVFFLKKNPPLLDGILSKIITFCSMQLLKNEKKKIPQIRPKLWLKHQDYFCTAFLVQTTAHPE